MNVLKKIIKKDAIKMSMNQMNQNQFINKIDEYR